MRMTAAVCLKFFDSELRIAALATWKHVRAVAVLRVEKNRHKKILLLKNGEEEKQIIGLIFAAWLTQIFPSPFLVYLVQSDSVITSVFRAARKQQNVCVKSETCVCGVPVFIPLRAIAHSRCVYFAMCLYYVRAMCAYMPFCRFHRCSECDARISYEFFPRSAIRIRTTTI